LITQSSSAEYCSFLRFVSLVLKLAVVLVVVIGICSWDSNAGKCDAAAFGKTLADIITAETPVVTSAGTQFT